jgi:hypothetical protein
VRAWIYNLIVAVLMVGCATTNTELGTEHQGVELHVDPRPFLTVQITRMTVESAGQTQDLSLNPATGTFDATLFLPAGMQSVVARAFAGDMLVGQSQPTPVQVTPGTITRVLLRIFDLTGTPGQVYGPILDTLAFPTTTDAGTTVTFVVSAVAPFGDPVTYAWSSDCMDSMFTAPSAATTGWSKAAQGTCTITVAATSNGFTVGQSFGILVFPAGANIGAVDASATFINSPFLILSFGAIGCFVGPGTNGSCPTTIASPAVTDYDANVGNWGGGTPGTLDLSDNCGGRFGISSRSFGDVNGFWLPPVGGGLCLVTAHALSGDGLSATVTVAVLTHAGTAAVVRPPAPSVFLENGCNLGSSAMPPDCGSFQAGIQHTVFGSVNWGDGHPGSVTISDDCAGAQPDVGAPAFFFSTTWQAPNTPGTTCTTTVRATNLEGVITEIAARYHLVAPPSGG